MHAIVTEGDVNKDVNWWKGVDYIPYEFLRKSWHKDCGVIYDIREIKNRKDIL